MKIKGIAVRITALILFFAMTAAVILYQAGAYDISFIKRPHKDGDVSTDGITETTDPANTFVDISQTLPPIDDDEVQQMLDSIKNINELDGYSVTYDMFSSDTVLVRLNSTLTEDGTFSLRNMTKEKTVVYSLENGRLGTKKQTLTLPRARLSLYFGFVLVDNGKTLDIYTAEGGEVIKSFDGVLLYALAGGHPAVKLGEEYFALTSEGLMSVAEDEVSYLMLSFDHPRYYGVNSTGLYPFAAEIEQLVFVGNVPTEPPPTTEPDSTEPDSTEPDSTEPDSTESDTTESDTTESDTTESDTTESDTTESDSTEPDSTDADSTELDSTEPDSTEPDSTEPDSTEADSTEPDSSENMDVSVVLENAGESGEVPVISSESDTTEPTDSTESTESTGSTDSTEPDSTEPDSTEPETTDRVIENGTVEVDGKYYKVTYVTRYGYKNADGDVVIQPRFVTAGMFNSEGYAAVTDGENNLFYINTKGEEKATLRNNTTINAPQFNNNRYRQMLEFGLNPTSDDLGMYYYDNGYVMVRYSLRSTWTYSRLYLTENRLLSAGGKLISVPGGYRLENYSDGVMLVSKNGLYGYMSPELSWICPAMFDDAHPFYQGLAVVGSGGRYGMIDTDGNTVLPLDFDYISDASSGIIAAHSEKRGWELFAIASLNENNEEIPDVSASVTEE